MAKEKVMFVCEECGSKYPRWQGQCKSCQAWNSIVEIKIDNEKSKNKVQQAISKTNNNNNNNKWVESTSKNKFLSEVSNGDNVSLRFSTGKKEFDRVLGGGVVNGSLILLFGLPGAGKSTLILEVCEEISKNKNVIYISGEESESQIKSRSDRLNISGKNIEMMTETEINKIIDHIVSSRPDFVVIDSIQTIYNADSDYSFGSSAALKENSAILNRIAKSTGIAILIIGHINKNGDVAGPKALEHIVDTICEIENENNSEYRIIRASKNRFGNTDEVGVFLMTERGMESVDNPSEIFISKDRDSVNGTNVLATIEGNRPLLIETQALVSDTDFNYPKRLASGIELNRLNLNIAILNNHTNIRLNEKDVYVSTVGGIKISDPAIDLPLSLSIISSYLKKPLSNNTACFGELDLTGRLRPVPRADLRIKEAILRGFERIIIPYRNIPKNPEKFNIEIIGAKDILDVVNQLKY